MKEWQMICQWLQEVVNFQPKHFVEANEIYKKIILAHYEEIYGE
jgi:hypothetical protein